MVHRFDIWIQIGKSFKYVLQKVYGRRIKPEHKGVLFLFLKISWKSVEERLSYRFSQLRVLVAIRYGGRQSLHMKVVISEFAALLPMTPIETTTDFILCS